MPTRKILASGGIADVVLAIGGLLPAHAQGPLALTGQVASVEEGPMEGVLVSAKKNGSTVTITVVSDAQGNFSFPAAKLQPGQYSLRIRAIGYDLDRPANVDVIAQQSAKFDLKLRKTEDLAAQLSNGEWLASFPGSDQEKNAMLGCVGCHTLSASEHGEPAKLARGRQGPDAEQRLCRRPQARPRNRQNRDLGAIQGSAQGRAAQHLRRDSGLQKQPLFHRLPPEAYRPDRRQD